ncbi:MAG: hypothetical protein GY711_21675 [bacterium]|nr:hypothetical protein [bacterium]
MNERTQAILDAVRSLRARWLRVRWVEYGLQSLFYLMLLSALVLLIFPDLGKGALAVTLLGGAAVLGALVALVKRPNEAAMAKDYDDVAGLKDRISSTIELVEQKATGPMFEALVEDASMATQRVTPQAVYPYRVPREGRWLAVPLLLIAAVLFLPGILDASEPVEPKVAETIEARIDQLEEILSKEKNKELSQRKKDLLEELEKLKAELSKDKVDKKDAMAEIAKMLEQLEKQQEQELQKKIDLKKMLAGLKEENKDLEEMLQNGDHQDALNKIKEKIDELEKKLKEKGKQLTPEELEKLEELLRKYKEIEAQLLKMLQINADLDFTGEVMDFLKFFEGDLADLEDLEFGGILKPCDCDDPGT